jgi:hypothetical protein
MQHTLLHTDCTSIIVAQEFRCVHHCITCHHICFDRGPRHGQSDKVSIRKALVVRMWLVFLGCWLAQSRVGRTSCVSLSHGHGQFCIVPSSCALWSLDRHCGLLLAVVVCVVVCVCVCAFVPVDVSVHRCFSNLTLHTTISASLAHSVFSLLLHVTVDEEDAQVFDVRCVHPSLAVRHASITDRGTATKLACAKQWSSLWLVFLGRCGLHKAVWVRHVSLCGSL